MYCKGRTGLKLISRYTMMLLTFVVLLTAAVPSALARGTTGTSDSKNWFSVRVPTLHHMNSIK